MWSLINVWNKMLKIPAGIGLFGIIILISGCSQSNMARAQEEPYYRELSLFRQATDLLDQEEYTQAHRLYTLFLEKYPKHPYADDAAYRLAYLHVVYSENNPYFSYDSARVVFQKFIENYQNSRYIKACQNWLYVIESRPVTATRVNEKNKTTYAPSDNNPEQELQKLREENTRLKQNLIDLQRAIE